MTGGGGERRPPRPARLAANRRNALRSTGPKSPAGKRRAARNALRHGLAVPLGADPGLLARIEALSRLIAGEGASGARLARARRVAEAQADLDRVRAARLALLAGGMETGVGDPAGTRPCALDPGAATSVVPDDRSARPSDTTAHTRCGLRLVDAPEPGATVWHDLARRLARLDRYEARARSRRRSAGRAWDAARAEEAADGDVLAGSVRQNEANRR